MSERIRITRRDLFQMGGGAVLGFIAGRALGGCGRLKPEFPEVDMSVVAENTTGDSEPTATPTEIARPSATPTQRPTSTENETETAAATATPESLEDFPIPLAEIKLEEGEETFPEWGYGPFGVPGVEYPKVLPEGEVKPGSWQLVTDFDGQNWRPEGRFEYTVAPGVTEIWGVTQGDAPAKVLWDKDEGTLTFWTDEQVTVDAPDSWNNQVKKPSRGSTGISLVIYVK